MDSATSHLPDDHAPGAHRPQPPTRDSTGPGTSQMNRLAAPSPSRGKHGHVLHHLGQMIVSGTLSADHPLVPDEIGQRFQVSRTVVREVLRVLESKGMVSPRPNTGTRVRPVSDWNLLDPDIIEWRAFGPQRDEQRRELLELRWTIEPVAAYLAARHGRDDVQQRLAAMAETMAHATAQGDTPAFTRADAVFHAVLLQAAGNRMLEHLSRIVSCALHTSGGTGTGCHRLGDTSVSLHHQIVTALAEGDGDTAQAAARQLLTTSSEPPPAPATHHTLPAPRQP